MVLDQIIQPGVVFRLVGRSCVSPAGQGEAPRPTHASHLMHGRPNTRTGQIVGACNRAKNSTTISDVDYVPTPDPSWPANSIIITDTTCGHVIEDFLIDKKGVPLDANGSPLGTTGR